MKSFVATLILVSSLSAGGFNENWKKIPVTFKGDSPTALAKAVGVKGEYESKDSYQKKMDKLGLGDKTFSFMSIPEGYRKITCGYDITYNAENEVFEFRTNSATNFLVGQNSANLGSFVGQNAFGVTKTIRRSKEITYKLVESDLREDILSFTLPAASKIAPALRKDIAFVYIVGLVSPYVDSSEYYTQATISSPHEGSYQDYSIYIEMLQVIVYRRSDRTILANITPNKLSDKQIEAKKVREAKKAENARLEAKRLELEAKWDEENARVREEKKKQVEPKKEDSTLEIVNTLNKEFQASSQGWVRETTWKMEKDDLVCYCGFSFMAETRATNLRNGYTTQPAGLTLLRSYRDAGFKSLIIRLKDGKDFPILLSTIK